VTVNSKSNQFTFISSCTKVVNLVKFPQLVHKIFCWQSFGTHAWTNARRDTWKTCCLRHHSDDDRGKKMVLILMDCSIACENHTVHQSSLITA